MTKTPIALQELRRRIYRKAKSEKAHRFWGIFVHVTRKETLEEAYRIAKRNGGAAGIDGQTFATIETAGLECFLADIKDDLETGRYKPHPNRRVDIPKEQGKVRTLQIPCIRDRVVQGALKLERFPFRRTISRICEVCSAFRSRDLIKTRGDRLAEAPDGERGILQSICGNFAQERLEFGE
jgi:retron-type reverse transcriptase